VIRRHVERLEVVEVVFDLRAFEDLVAHAGEDVLDFLADAHERMNAPERELAARQGHVDGAGRRPAGAEGGTALLERRLDLGLQLVDEGTGFTTQLRRQRAELLEQTGDRSGLAAEELVVQRLEVRIGTRGGSPRAEIRAQCLNR
jgi:hypothetical protein